MANTILGVTQSKLSKLSRVMDRECCGDCNNFFLDNSNTVTFEGGGAYNNPILARVVVSKQAGNNLTIKKDGLYVPESNTNVKIQDTQSIHLIGNGTIGNPLIGDVKISATSDNLLTIESDGLYVAAAAFDQMQFTNSYFDI